MAFLVRMALEEANDLDEADRRLPRPSADLRILLRDRRRQDRPGVGMEASWDRLRRRPDGRDAPPAAARRQGRRAPLGRRPLRGARPPGQGGPRHVRRRDRPAPDGPAGRHEVEPAQRPLRDDHSTRLWVANASKTASRPSPSPTTPSGSPTCSPTSADPGAPALPLPSDPRPRPPLVGFLDTLRRRGSRKPGTLRSECSTPATTPRHDSDSQRRTSPRVPPSAGGTGPSQDQRRADEQAGDHDADGQGVARAGELAHQALEVLEVEPDGQLAALDRFERLAQHVGQEHRDPLHVLGGPDRLGQEPPGVEPPQGQVADERLELARRCRSEGRAPGRRPRSSPASGSGGRGRAGCAGGGCG